MTYGDVGPSKEQLRIAADQSKQISKLGEEVERLRNGLMRTAEEDEIIKKLTERAEAAEAERDDITAALVRLQDESKELHAPGKVASLKAALSGCETLLKTAEAERDELRKALEYLANESNWVEHCEEDGYYALKRPNGQGGKQIGIMLLSLYLCPYMVAEAALKGGEESGG